MDFSSTFFSLFCWCLNRISFRCEIELSCIENWTAFEAHFFVLLWNAIGRRVVQRKTRHYHRSGEVIISHNVSRLSFIGFVDFKSFQSWSVFWWNWRNVLCGKVITWTFHIFLIFNFSLIIQKHENFPQSF